MSNQRYVWCWWAALQLLTTACGSDTDTTGKTADDSDATEHDDHTAENTTESTEENTAELPEDLEAAYRLYYETTCAYYARCSPDVLAFYGGQDGCAALARASFSELQNGAIRAYITPYLESECIKVVRNLDCPTLGSKEASSYFDTVQHIAYALSACANFEKLPCQSAVHCPSGSSCSAGANGCGTCQITRDTCQAFTQCPAGNGCVDGACVARATIACESDGDCEGFRCQDGACVRPQAVGEPCVTHEDCDTMTWCNAGVCARAGGEGATCDQAALTSCSIEYTCYEGTCQHAELTDVPIGALCSSFSNCVAGASCEGSVCTASTVFCETERQCAEGEYCNGDCFARKANGAACSSHDECTSFRCTDELCIDANPCD